MIKNVGWSIGNFCNARCKHCYSWQHRKENEDILSKEEIDVILNKLISYGVKTVNFGGNEPIFTDGTDINDSKLPYIIRTLSSHGILCGITTNGFTAQYLHDHFKDEYLMVNDWDFSLDSPCKELHDENRGVNGLFDLVIESIKRCHQYNKPCSIVIAGMKTNLDKESLEKYIELARENDTSLRINILKPIEKRHFDLMPTYKQVYDAFRFLLNNTRLVTLSESVIAAQLGIKSGGCPCGIHSFRIQAKKQGRVSVTPCVYLDIEDNDILTMEIDDIIQSESFKKIVKRNLDLPSECRKKDCKYLETCRGGCSASTLLVKGNLDAVSPYCPLEHEEIEQLTDLNIGIEHAKNDFVRVHENYLCTWIGEIKN